MIQTLRAQDEEFIHQCLDTSSGEAAIQSAERHRRWCLAGGGVLIALCFAARVAAGFWDPITQVGLVMLAMLATSSLHATSNIRLLKLSALLRADGHGKP